MQAAAGAVVRRHVVSMGVLESFLRPSGEERRIVEGWHVYVGTDLERGALKLELRRSGRGGRHRLSSPGRGW